MPNNAFDLYSDKLGIRVDATRAQLAIDALNDPRLDRAMQAMAALEAGEIANPDEQRRVGHYWLRNPNLAPPTEATQIRDTLNEIDTLAERVRASGRFDTILVIGMGGSSLSPYLMDEALADPDAKIKLAIIENTDPDGVDKVLAGLHIKRTLMVGISKSGGTIETKNGILAFREACRQAGVSFAERAIAITCRDSKLDRQARDENWMASVPMWDWVGGRFSATSAVGMLPAALLGLDWRAFLQGAAEADRATRAKENNPALLLTASWLAATDGRAQRSMVVLPYRDRLHLLPRYIQQIVMESLGKRHDTGGREVHQGLTTYGSIGTTYQHAILQQLSEGPDDCFINFVTVLKNEGGGGISTEEFVLSGDYLMSFLLGARRALTEAGRKIVTISLNELTPYTLGALIALYERCVGLYGAAVGINPYHQPGVESSKRAAGAVIELQQRILAGEDIDDPDAHFLRAYLLANGRLQD